MKDMHDDAARVVEGRMHPSKEALFHDDIVEPVEPADTVRLSLGFETDKPVTKLALVIGNREIESWCRNNPFNMPSSPARPYFQGKRTELISYLFQALGIDSQAIAAVAQYKRERMTQALAGLSELAPALREVQEELDRCCIPEKAAELARTAAKIRGSIKRALTEAENLGIDDPFVRRLRAAHPAE